MAYYEVTVVRSNTDDVFPYTQIAYDDFEADSDSEAVAIAAELLSVYPV